MMKDEDKSKRRLIEELVALRQQVAELQTNSISAKESNQLAKEALSESEERYRRLLEISFDAITIHRAGKLVAVNEPGASLYGAASPEELVGKPILDFVHPDFLEAVQARIRQTRVEGKEVSLIEEKLLRLDGTSLDVEVAAIPVTYQGQPAVQAVVRNISRRKRAEEALRESETKFRTLAETTTAAIFIYQGVQFRYVNPAAEAIAGYTQAELLEMNLLDVIHPDFRQLTNDRRVARLRGEPVPSPYEVKILTKDGQERWLELSAGLIEFEGEPAVLGTAFDITKRKLIQIQQERLLAAEREQRQLAETLSEIFLTLTAQTSRRAVLDEILRQAQRVVPCSAANIMLLDDNVLRPVRWNGYEIFGSEDYVIDLEQSLADYPLDATAIQTCQPLVVPNTRQDPRWVTVAESAWIRSHLSVPISLRNQVLGLLRLDGDIPNQFSPKDAKRLQPLASAAAIALENARFYDQTRQERVERIIQAETEIIQLDHKLQTLQHASSAITSSLDFQAVLDTVTKEMANLLKVDGCAIFEWNQVVDKIYITVRYGLDSRWEEGSLPSELYPLADYPLIKRVLVEQRPQQITSSHPSFYPAELALIQQAKLRTLLMLPMRVQDRIVGLVKMMDSQVERTFTNNEIGLVQLLANQIASAIENNRLYAQVRQEISERLQIEKALRWVATRNQAILHAIPDSLFYFNGEGQLMGYKVSPDTSLTPGILGEFTIGKNLNKMLPADLADQILRCIDQTLTSGTMELFEYQLPRPEGRQDFEIRLVTSGSNEVLAIVRNITARKRAVEAMQQSAKVLAESEARLMAEMQSVLIITRALVSQINLSNLLEFIMTQAEHLTNADGAVVLLLSDDDQWLEVATPGESWLRIKPGSRLPVQGSLAELAVTSQQVQISNHPHNDDRTESIRTLLRPAEVRSLLCAPLTVQHKNLGALLIWSEQGHMFTVPDSRLIGLFADQAALALHNAELHTENRQLAIQQERDRLAREFHDSVTQSLYSIGLVAQSVLRLLGQDADSMVRNPIEYIHTLSETTLAEMREQLYHLHPTVFDEDLVKALTKHCKILGSQYPIEIEFKPRLRSPLSANQRNALFYITREALWNVVRHARATQVIVGLTDQDDQIVVSIEDNGVGFDPSLRTGGQTLGLRNIEQRAKHLAGTFELQSRPGQGTRLIVRLPLHPP